jgi:hypothetical protein
VAAGGGEEQAVLHRQEADHLRHRLARVIIIRNDSSTQASAMPSVPLASAVDEAARSAAPG